MPFPDLVKNIVSGNFVSISYIKEDIISHMYLESYTNIMKSYFSFMMLLRFKHCFVSMATTPVQAFFFLHLAHCESFMTCLPSVSSSLRLPCPLLPDSSFQRFVSIIRFTCLLSDISPSSAFPFHYNLASEMPIRHIIAQS